MNKPNPGDFQDVIDQANQMAQGPLTSPFGVPQRTMAQGPTIPVQQTTQVFILPRDAAAYDECCNELWAGRGKARFEERTFNKESEVVIVLCYFTEAPAQRPAIVGGGGGGEEAKVQPYRLP